MRPALLAALIASAMAAAVASAAEPAAPPPTSPTQPLGGSRVDARPVAGQPRLISWAELVPKGWDPMKDFRNIDLGKLDDSDPRANEMLMKLQEAFDKAPVNAEMDGVEVKIPGFIVPLEENQGEITEFLLVPYFGACIHTPPPPANQVLHVLPKQPARFRSMDTVWVSGKLRTVRDESMMGVSGYQLSADTVTRYTGAKP